jgi:hypothetical protein
MAEDGRESKNGEGRLAKRTQTSGAKALSPTKQILSQRRRDAEEGILESPGILPPCAAALHEFIRPICEYVGLKSFGWQFGMRRN